MKFNKFNKFFISPSFFWFPLLIEPNCFILILLIFQIVWYRKITILILINLSTHKLVCLIFKNTNCKVSKSLTRNFSDIFLFSRSPSLEDVGGFGEDAVLSRADIFGYVKGMLVKIVD